MWLGGLGGGGGGGDFPFPGLNPAELRFQIAAILRPCDTQLLCPNCFVCTISIKHLAMA